LDFKVMGALLAKISNNQARMEPASARIRRVAGACKRRVILVSERRGVRLPKA
jgi:hypothetical protein